MNMKILYLVFVAILLTGCNNGYKEIATPQYTSIVGISFNECICHKIKQEDKSNE